MDFKRIASFNNKLQAETTAHLLDEAGIPFIIHDNEPIFGAGGVSSHVFLSVPVDRVAEALERIRGLTESPDGP